MSNINILRNDESYTQGEDGTPIINLLSGHLVLPLCIKLREMGIQMEYINDHFEVLLSGEKYHVAYSLFCFLIKIAKVDSPPILFELEQYPDMIKDFMLEVLADIEDYSADLVGNFDKEEIS